MNNYGSMEEEKKGGMSLADKLKAFTSKGQKPGSNTQKFDNLQSEQDLEGQTISLRDDDRGPKSAGSNPAAAAAPAEETKSFS